MASPEDTMILDTTKGKVVIAMRPDLAPGHVARIKELVRQGFYDGIVFHRVIDGFMAQTGCPHGTGTGGSGKKLKAEFNKEPHVRGTVSMARAQNPNSGDSQFFICFGDATFLDSQYTAWGNVVEGMENVDKIKRGEPVRDPDKIVKATMAADKYPPSGWRAPMAVRKVRRDPRHDGSRRDPLHAVERLAAAVVGQDRVDELGMIEHRRCAEQGERRCGNGGRQIHRA